MAKKRRFPKTMPMRALEDHGSPYELHIHACKQYTAEGVAEDLGIPLAQVVKAMVVSYSGGRFAVVILPGDRRLSLKKLGAALGDKNVAMASERDVERVTGFRVGSVSAVGLRRADVPSFVDQAVLELEEAVISSGRPDAGLSLSPSVLLQAMVGAEVGDFSEDA
jgi:Cys-tRNA(Pro)/Cys-tRNA(Cys) deacylase